MQHSQTDRAQQERSVGVRILYVQTHGDGEAGEEVQNFERI